MRISGRILIWLLSSLAGLLLTLTAVDAGAQTPQQDFSRRFASPLIEFPLSDSKYAAVSSGRYPALLRWIFQKALSWNPLGLKEKYSPACEPEIWGERLQDPRMSNIQLQGALIQKYFQDCGRELKTGSNSYFWNTLRILTMNYSPQEHPFLHRVVFHLPGQIALKGLLALKGDLKKRPFVVIRLGIFSSIEEFLPERYLLMQMFEQSPFNVLVLENMTSPDFIANNDRFSFGGYDEGLQNILVAKALTDPHQALNRLVDSLHFAAVSLGGHGLFYASLLNDLNGSPIQSFIGFCPVVNLQPTMKHLNQNQSLVGIEAKLANYWSSQRLAGLRRKIPELADVSSFSFLASATDILSRHYQGGLSYTPTIRLPPGVSDSPDFWQQNQFWDSYQDVQKPVMVWATTQDPAVPYALNAATLKSKNIKVVSFQEGIHCTLPIPYRWDALTTLIQSYIFSHANGFKLRTEKMQIDVTDEKLTGDDGVVPFTISWPAKKERFVRIEMKGFQLSLPLNNFDFQFLNPTLSLSEKNMLQRWLYQNLKVQLEIKEGKRYLLVTWKRV